MGRLLLIPLLGLACCDAVSQEERRGGASGSQKMGLTVTLPKNDWLIPMGARIPVAGSIRMSGEGIIPDGLLVTVERTSRGRTQALGRKVIKLRTINDNLIIFIDVLQIDGASYQHESDHFLAFYPTKGDSVLPEFRLPIAKQALKIDSDHHIHWSRDEHDVDRVKLVDHSSDARRAKGELSLLKPNEARDADVLLGGSFVVTGGVEWEPLSASRPNVVLLMYSEPQEIGRHTQLTAIVLDPKQLPDRQGAELPQATIIKSLRLPKDYFQSPLYVKAVFLGEGNRDIGQTNVVPIRVREP